MLAVTSVPVMAITAVAPKIQSLAHIESASDLSSSIEMSSLHSSERSDTEYQTTKVPLNSGKPVRRLSEVEAQRADVCKPERGESGALNNSNENVGPYNEDDSSMERGFDEILGNISDESSWDSS